MPVFIDPSTYNLLGVKPPDPPLNPDEMSLVKRLGGLPADSQTPTALPAPAGPLPAPAPRMSIGYPRDPNVPQAPESTPLDSEAMFRDPHYVPVMPGSFPMNLSQTDLSAPVPAAPASAVVTRPRTVGKALPANVASGGAPANAASNQPGRLSDYIGPDVTPPAEKQIKPAKSTLGRIGQHVLGALEGIGAGLETGNIFAAPIGAIKGAINPQTSIDTDYKARVLPAWQRRTAQQQQLEARRLDNAERKARLDQITEQPSREAQNAKRESAQRAIQIQLEHFPGMKVDPALASDAGMPSLGGMASPEREQKPDYTVGADGNFYAVSGTRVQPVTGPSGQPFRVLEKTDKYTRVDDGKYQYRLDMDSGTVSVIKDESGQPLRSAAANKQVEPPDYVSEGAAVEELLQKYHLQHGQMKDNPAYAKAMSDIQRISTDRHVSLDTAAGIYRKTYGGKIPVPQIPAEQFTKEEVRAQQAEDWRRDHRRGAGTGKGNPNKGGNQGASNQAAAAAAEFEIASGEKMIQNARTTGKNANGQPVTQEQLDQANAALVRKRANFLKRFGRNPGSS